MQFRITRVSSNHDREQPCPQAYEIGGKWFIDVDTLEALVALVDSTRDKNFDEGIIVSIRDGILRLDIYDNYRE